METETVRAGWRARAAGLGRGAAGTVLGIIYPPTCIGCGGATGEPHTLCARCWSEIAVHRAALLRAPRHAVRGRSRHGRCCRRPRSPIRRCSSGPAPSARYDDVARKLVHRLKYGDRLELARALGAMMVRSGAELLADAEIDRAGAAPSLASVVAALQPGDGARERDREAERRALRSRSSSPASRRRSPRSGSRRRSAARTCRAPSACRRRRSPGSTASASSSSTT